MKITDVAKEAGVSITTVSRALNGNYPIKQETREKIERAIEKLGYRPNAAARSMKTGRSMNIGITAPGLTNLYFPAIIEAVEHIVSVKGYKLMILSTEGDPKKEREALEDLVARQIDGIIALDPAGENLREGFLIDLATKVPLLVVNGDPGSYEGDRICYREERGAEKALKRLIELGHQRIALIRGERSVSFDLRETVYNRVMEEMGGSYRRIITVGRSNSHETIKLTAKEIGGLLDEKLRPTALFACNDLMGLSALNVCKERGLRVPEDISLIGFDNTIFSMATSPTLSTVDLRMDETGRCAGEGIVEMIEDREKRVRIELETEYMERGSCGKAPGV